MQEAVQDGLGINARPYFKNNYSTGLVEWITWWSDCQARVRALVQILILKKQNKQWGHLETTCEKARLCYKGQKSVVQMADKNLQYVIH
jgi:hypothetical protein